MGIREEWWPGAEWIAGYASSHFVRLSALCASVEPPRRIFSIQLCLSTEI